MADPTPRNDGRPGPVANPLIRWFLVGVVPRTFAALHYRNFRLFWVGSFLSLIGTWMQNIARGWLVLELTNSPFLVGLESTIAWLPAWIVSLPAGVLADHFNKRNLMIAGQSVLAVLALVLAVLTFTGAINIYYILVISGLTGFVVAMNAPIRQSLMPALVDRKDLLNAIALGGAAFNGARIIGPSIAGMALAAIGAGGCFAINSASFLFLIVALAFIRLDPVPKPDGSESAWQRLVAGVRFVARSKDIRVLMLMAGVYASFGIVYLPLMPVFARDVFRAGPGGYGVMMAAVGVGALTGLLTIASIARTRHRGLILMGGSAALAVLLVCYSLLRSFPAAIVALILMGFAQSSVGSLTNTLIQTLVPDEVRGRVMSIFTMSFLGMFPLGSLLAGAVAQRWGAPASTILGGCVILASLATVNLLRPQIRRL